MRAKKFAKKATTHTTDCILLRRTQHLSLKWLTSIRLSKSNLRCGAWYVEPNLAQREPVYFKSTDGHFGQWAFNLRRANLHLLDDVEKSGGCASRFCCSDGDLTATRIILVDSTRHGKRFPDALSKTIPIWCAVVNLAVAKISDTSEELCRKNIDLEENSLYTPPGSAEVNIPKSNLCWENGSTNYCLRNSQFHCSESHSAPYGSQLLHRLYPL
ncbi:hypothetical protein K439DRAFT_365218 [Ramaria rubella]|nr:hypothetical protein K439DRAFT_365218 [Ramaria rubella]